MSRLLLLFAVLTLAAGCAVQPPQPVSDPAAVWASHQQRLARIDSWHLNGRLAIVTADEGWQTFIDWRQQGDSYTIRISGPFGQGAVSLEGNRDGVLLTDENGQREFAHDPEWLLWDRYGWRVPVASLRYWVLGLPAPGENIYTLDPYGHLGELEESIWKVKFRSYTESAGQVLPEKLNASNHQARIKLVVSDWQIQQGSGQN